jgi:DNA-binding response OmpR family regulator
VTGADAAGAGAGGATAGVGGVVTVVLGVVVAGVVVAVVAGEDGAAGTRCSERTRALVLAADRAGLRAERRWADAVDAGSGVNVAGERECPGKVLAAAAAKDAVSSTAIVVTPCLATLNRRSARSLARERRARRGGDMQRASARRLNRPLPLDENPLFFELAGDSRPYDGSVTTVALIEDEPGIVDFVSRGLASHGLEVRSALDGERGLELALADGIDLVVLDLMLPRLSGEEILRELAERRPWLPVIVLTARGELDDRVSGLRAGAVDYLVKPFALAELEARIDAQLRAGRQAPTTSIGLGALYLDLLTRRVVYDGRTIHLSNTEFDLLSYFARNAGQVLTRQQIHRAVWGYDHDPATNVVDVYVGYLRRKLTAPEEASITISAIRSRGYRLEPPR